MLTLSADNQLMSRNNRAGSLCLSASTPGPVILNLRQVITMPIFMCPCCGGSYIVPLAFSEAVLEEHQWSGKIAPVRCAHCQRKLEAGAIVFLRNGQGITEKGTPIQIVEGEEATIIDVVRWADDGSIFLVQLPDQRQAYVYRAMLSPHKNQDGYFLSSPKFEDGH